MKRERIKFGHSPTLLVYESLEDAIRRGCVLFFHGLGASKEVQLPDLEDIAKRGFLAVGVDNIGHGERKYPDFEKRLSQANPDYDREFLQVVEKTAQDVPFLIDELTRAGYIQNEKIGALGISMGGYITYSAILAEPRIKVAATIVGSPEWMVDAPESPHHHIEQFSTIKLLSQTAGKDEVVPSHYTRRFHGRLEEAYTDYDERFAYVEYSDSDHLMNPDWNNCWTKTLDWFEKHLV